MLSLCLIKQDAMNTYGGNGVKVKTHSCPYAYLTKHHAMKTYRRVQA
jgi:hypothetical protein